MADTIGAKAGKLNMVIEQGATFSAEGQAAVNLRDATWQAAHQIFTDFEADPSVIPTWEEVEAQLPQLTW